MKGIRFYLEYEDNKKKRKATRKEPGNHLGNVVAVFPALSQIKFGYSGYLHCPVYDCEGNKLQLQSEDLQTNCPVCGQELTHKTYPIIVYDAVASPCYDEPDSATCSTSVSQDYLNDRCKYIGEDLARSIHPSLFQYLDD